MAKKAAAPVKKASPKKASPVKSAKASPKKAAVAAGAGRPAGALNFVPTKPLSTRDTGKFKGVFDGPIGPRWIRVYALDQESSLLLKQLATMIDKQDPELTKLLRRKAK